MGKALDIPQAQGQYGLHTIQCLNLALFVDADRDSMMRQVQVQSDNTPYLLDKEGIRGELKAVFSTGLESKGMPDTTNRLRGDMRGLGQGAERPMGAALGFALKRFADENNHLFVKDTPGAPGAELFV
jgi:hypothetical protein